MKFRFALRVLRERDRVAAEIKALADVKTQAEDTVRNAEAERAKVFDRLEAMREERERHNAALEATEKRHTAERQWLKEKHRAEMLAVQEQINATNAKVVEIEHERLRAQDAVQQAEQTVAAFEPKRSKLDVVLRNIEKDVPTAQAKVDEINAREEERKKKLAAAPVVAQPDGAPKERTYAKLAQEDGRGPCPVLAGASAARRRRMMRRR